MASSFWGSPGAPRTTPRALPEGNLYEILHVHPKASDDEVRLAYNKAFDRILYHPAHVNVSNAQRTKELDQWTVIFHVLCNKTRRRRYDVLGNTARSVDFEPDPASVAQIMNGASMMGVNAISREKAIRCLYEALHESGDRNVDFAIAWMLQQGLDAMDDTDTDFNGETDEHVEELALKRCQAAARAAGEGDASLVRDIESVMKSRRVGGVTARDALQVLGRIDLLRVHDRWGYIDPNTDQLGPPQSPPATIADYNLFSVMRLEGKLHVGGDIAVIMERCGVSAAVALDVLACPAIYSPDDSVKLAFAMAAYDATLDSALRAFAQARQHLDFTMQFLSEDTPVSAGNIPIAAFRFPSTDSANPGNSTDQLDTYLSANCFLFDVCINYNESSKRFFPVALDNADYGELRNLTLAHARQIEATLEPTKKFQRFVLNIRSPSKFLLSVVFDVKIVKEEEKTIKQEEGAQPVQAVSHTISLNWHSRFAPKPYVGVSPLENAHLKKWIEKYKKFTWDEPEDVDHRGIRLETIRRFVRLLIQRQEDGDVGPWQA